ncbi:MAG TPA: hypothetical protein VLF17_01690, partial [Candidatus Nitrosotenuis sp.]|nr:hypothetical protein [Candidatus Nitrosotenuis sp.]
QHLIVSPKTSCHTRSASTAVQAGLCWRKAGNQTAGLRANIKTAKVKAGQALSVFHRNGSEPYLVPMDKWPDPYKNDTEFRKEMLKDWEKSEKRKEKLGKLRDL